MKYETEKKSLVNDMETIQIYNIVLISQANQKKKIKLQESLRLSMDIFYKHTIRTFLLQDFIKQISKCAACIEKNKKTCS